MLGSFFAVKPGLEARVACAPTIFLHTLQHVCTPPHMTTCHTPPLIIAIEGNIGVGKSTVMKHLEDTFQDDDRVIVIPEPVDDWEHKGFLRTMYDNAHNTWMLATFQHMVLMSLTGVLLKALHERPLLIITERSPWSNFHIFGKAALPDDGMSMAMYRHTWEHIVDGLQFVSPPRFIHLDAEVSTVMHRVVTRARDSEATVKVEYLTELHTNHREFMGMQRDRCVTVNADGDKDDVKRAVYMALKNFVRDVEGCKCLLPVLEARTKRAKIAPALEV